MKSEFKKRDWIDRMEERAAELREKSAGYSGLAGPFRAIEEKLRIDFKSSGVIRHPGDKGTARESVLRDVLTRDGYLPRRYAVAETSSHVLSSSGHISGQMDLLFYDALNAPRLLSLGGIQYFPIESCYGMIQAKSDLGDRGEIAGGLDNIASFKKLRVRKEGSLSFSDGFGILVAHTASLKWKTIFEAVQDWQAEHAASLWPNLVVVLDQGIIGHIDERRHVLHTSDVSRLDRSELQPIALGGNVLLTFYLLLLDLLGRVQLPRAPLWSYVSLPATAGEHSYQFAHGAFSQTRTCKEHGDYLRTIDVASIERILSHCPIGSEVDGQAALDLADGQKTGETNGPGRVLIYNPDGLPLPRILNRPAYLVRDGVPFRADSLSFEFVMIDGREYWLPEFYVVRDSLISACPKCGPGEATDGAVLTIDEWWEGLEALVEQALKLPPTDAACP